MANLINIGGGAGGGSSVEPNPQGTATDTLVKLGIEGTIYDFAGGGSGSSYSETTLWSGSETPSTSGTQITLSDNISNYDEIVFVLDTDYVGMGRFLVSELTIGERYISTIYAPTEYGVYWSYDSDTTVTIKRLATAHPIAYIKVIGIKYGSGSSGHNYSTTEQVVGTWIDGSTVYEKTINVGTITTNTTVAHGIDNLDTIIDYSGFGKYAGTDKTVMPFQNPASGYGFGINTYDGTNLVVAKASSLGSNMSDCYITLRYTKTTT
jgi:hypothetical protein